MEQNSLEINPYHYGQLIFDKGGRSIKWSKNSLFNKWYWEIWTSTCKKKKKKERERKKETRPPTYTIYQNKLKMDKKFNIRCDTIKVLEENVGRKISVIPHCNIFTDTSPREGI